MNANLRQAADMVARSDKWWKRPLQNVYSNPIEEFKEWGEEHAHTSLWKDSPDRSIPLEFDRYEMENLMTSLGLSTDVKHWFVVHSKENTLARSKHFQH